MLKINKDIQIGDTGRTLEMLGETVAETLPVGTIAPYGGSTSQVPQNWLPCDGREVSRLEYAKLFSVIGTRFGVGDGSTTFNLPDLQGKVPVGQDVNDTAFDVLGETGGEKTHTLTVSEMPAHDHNIEGYKGVGQWADGELWFRAAGQGSDNTFVSANRSANTGGGQAHNNLQPYQVTLYIIKAFDQQLGNLRSESLPVGSEIDFDGTAAQIPEGWEEISDDVKLLWTNSSPASAFAGQTITLSSGDYDFYEVYFTYNEGSAIQYANGFKTVKGKGMIVFENGYTTGLSVRRKIDYVDATHLLISSAYAGTDANQNGYLIPIYVVGYKTGTFN